MKKDKFCSTCIHLCDRTKFCRLNPPVPVIFYDKETDVHNISSKFPVITEPWRDYCSNHTEK